MAQLVKYRHGKQYHVYSIYNQHHDWWWPGDARSQGICSYGIGLVVPEYSDLSRVGLIFHNTPNSTRTDICGHCACVILMFVLLKVDIRNIPSGGIDIPMLSEPTYSPKQYIVSDVETGFWNFLAKSSTHLCNTMPATQIKFLPKPYTCFYI